MGETMPLEFESISHGSIVFQELIKYVWAGGFPRWKDERRPDYVIAMKKKIEASENSLFEGLLLS